MEGELTTLVGPEDEDWRVPVSELEARQKELANRLTQAGHEAALIQTPVDLYYYSGGRQNGSLLVSANGEARFFVRRSLSRAIYESGGDNSPHSVEKFPRMSTFRDDIGCEPSMQFGELPHSFATKFASKVGATKDCTQIIHSQREVKSSWELEMMSDASDIQMAMFQAVDTVGGEGVSEIELVAAAEAVSRAAGVPSFFDSAIGGTGPHPMASMGSGFTKIKPNEPVLVDLVHVHRGYVVDTTRMYVAGSLSKVWEDRLDDLLAVKEEVVDILDQGLNCSEAWSKGYQLASELGHADNLMGMSPDQSKFLGHSVGLQLDETPVVAQGFDSPLPVGGVMAIEPKVVHTNGSIGSEDTWVRDEEGMRPITAGGAIPWITEW